MAELLTAGQMRAIEKAAIDAGEVTGLELMERAGRGTVEAIFAEWPVLAERPSRAAIVCGPGNNGGDGFVVARLLHERGWNVDVYLMGEPERLPPDARASHDAWARLGPVVPYDDADFWLEPETWGPDTLIVDALFGTGLTRPLVDASAFGWATQMARRDAADAASAAGAPRSRIVAIDIASGLCADSGRVLKPADPPASWEPVAAHLTATYHAAKLGHLLSDGPAACGRVRVVDIGLRPNGDAFWPGEVARVAAPSPRSGKGAGHKYDHGHALVLSGGVGKGGAARLAARAALRVGAGLVTVGCPPAALQENAAQLTAIMLRSVADAAALSGMLEDGRLNAVCIGPGFGLGERLNAMVAAILETKRAVVLDGDALTAFADDPAELFRHLHGRAVLTPHGGEFAKLFPDIAERLSAPAERGPAYSKVDATREAAARAGCVVLYKGPDTVIADAGGRAAINSAAYERSVPCLATAGSGDVLAGLITGLLARGLEPMAAAETAAWLHVEAALEFGPGLIAEDLPEALPAVFRRMGL